MKMTFEKAKEILKNAGLLAEGRTPRDNKVLEYLESAKKDLNTCIVLVGKASGEYDGKEPVLRNVYEKLRLQYGMIDYIIGQIKKTNE